jgi:hypothetical protein
LDELEHQYGFKTLNAELAGSELQRFVFPNDNLDAALKIIFDRTDLSYDIDHEHKTLKLVRE